MKKVTLYMMIFGLLAGLVIGTWIPKPILAQTPKTKPTAPLPGEIRVGLLATMSGPGAVWGTTYSRTCNKQIEDINKEGGLLVGGKRYLIKLFEYDNKRDPATSVEAAKKLVYTDKVRAMMHHGAVCVLPTLPMLSENKIVSMDISIGPRVVTWPYNFAILPEGRLISLNAYKAFSKLFGIKKVAEIAVDNDSGYPVEIDDRWAAKQVGAEIINSQFFPEDTTDFYPILTRAIASKPDMIVLGLGAPGNVPLIIKQARELGWQGPMGMTQGSLGAVNSVVQIAGQAAEGYVYAVPAHADRKFLSKEENEWMDYWLKRWGEPFVADTFLGYRQFNLWVQAVRKANSLDPDKITKVLETSEFVVQGWKIHFGVTPACYMGRARSLRAPLPISTIKEGKLAVIDLMLPEGVTKAP